MSGGRMTGLKRTLKRARRYGLRYFAEEALARLPVLSADVERVRREHLTYLERGKMYRLESTVRRVLGRNVPGAVVEFGVAMGGSAIVLAKAARRSGREFHGFDVFGMIPPPSSPNDGQDAKSRYETIASGVSKGLGGEVYYGYVDDLFGEVSRRFEAFGIPVTPPEVSLHKGLFEDTLPTVGLDRVAFAHVDCDWYDPVRYCLGWIAPRMPAGGAILIDDYHDYSGCRTAVDEFLSGNTGFKKVNGRNVLLVRRR